MNQTAKIAAGIKSLFAASPTLPGLVPGGLIYGIEKAGSLRPFATLLITPEGEPEYQTGVAYVQAYRVVIRVYAGQLVSAAGSIQTALQALLLANTKLALASNAITLHCSLEPAAIVESEERYRGQFTFIAGAAWLIQIQELRS